MPKTKKLTPEQKTFLTQFLVKGTRKEEKKLTQQYKDFLRRKTKILGEVYKLPPGDPNRRALEDEVNKIDQGKVANNTANFKGAYEQLEAVKGKARKAAKGLPPVTPADLEKRIDQLARSGFRRVRQLREVLDKMDALNAELQKPEHQVSACQNLTKAVWFLQDFGGKEDGFRAQLLGLVSAKDAIAKAVETFPLQEKVGEIRKEIAYLQEADGAGAGHLPGLLDRTLEAFKYNGEPLTKGSVNRVFDVKVNRFEELLRICKDLSKFKSGPEPLPDELKELEKRDKKRLAATRIRMVGELLDDKQYLGVTKDRPRQVDAPYRWQQCPEFLNYADTLPDTADGITPQTTQAARDAARQMIENALRTKANDSAFLFDLSIQTLPGLQALISRQMNVPAPAVKPELGAARDQLMKTKQRAGETIQLKRYVEATERFQQDGDVCSYAEAMQKIKGVCAKSLRQDKVQNDPETKRLYENLIQEIDQHLPEALKRKDFIRAVAQEMEATINQHSPNRASQETTPFPITTATGGQATFDAPNRVSVGGEDYTIKQFLGAGTNGIAFRYENAQGKTVVVKAFNDTSDQAKAKFGHEMKMHKHLLEGDDEGKEHVLKLEGAARGPDGQLYMLMEEAGGGTMERLGENLRALGGSGVLSQEALNAVNQHLIRQAVAGLKYLQQRNMTDHDVKADNFFLGADGTVKLADFGSAQVSANPEGEVPGPAVNPNLEGAPAFRAPEFYDSNTQILTGKADTYSLGVMIAKLTSPTDAQETNVETGLAEFRNPRTLTALDRLKNAMLDPDPTKRPTLEAIEYSSYLANDRPHDPGQVQELQQASLAYAQKVGREVASKQSEINSLQGLVLKAHQNAAPASDAELTAELPNGNAADLIRGQLQEGLSKLQDVRDKVQNNWSPEDLVKNYVAGVLKPANNAERLYQLANLNDNALRQEISDVLAAVRRECNQAVQGVQGQINAKRQEIADINNRPDVKPLVERVKQAQDALLRGPDGQKGQPTPEEQEKVLLRRKERLEKILPSLVGAEPNEKDLWQKQLDQAGDLALLEQYEQANELLDRMEKDLHRLGGMKLFEKQMKEALVQLQAAAVTPEEKSRLQGLLREALALATQKKMDQAYARYQAVARQLRHLEIEKEMQTA